MSQTTTLTIRSTGRTLTVSEDDLVAHDEDCGACGARAEARQCDGCGAVGIVTDCGHQMQPRPITAGRSDGSDLHYTYCEDCAEERVAPLRRRD